MSYIMVGGDNKSGVSIALQCNKAVKMTPKRSFLIGLYMLCSQALSEFNEPMSQLSLK